LKQISVKEDYFYANLPAGRQGTQRVGKAAKNLSNLQMSVSNAE